MYLAKATTVSISYVPNEEVNPLKRRGLDTEKSWNRIGELQGYYP